MEHRRAAGGKGDMPMLRIVLTNLLSNAQVHAKQPQTKIEVGARREDGRPSSRQGHGSASPALLDKMFGVFSGAPDRVSRDRDGLAPGPEHPAPPWRGSGGARANAAPRLHVDPARREDARVKD